MSQARTYRLSLGFRLYLGFFLLFFVFIVAMITGELIAGREPIQASLFFIEWLILALSTFGYQGFRGIASIALTDRTITFRALFRAVTVPVSELESVEASWWDLFRTFPVFRSRRRSFRLLGPFDNFHDLLNRVKELVPSIEIKRL